MTIPIDERALDAAVRRFPAVLSRARRNNAFPFDEWLLVWGFFHAIRAEYRRIIIHHRIVGDIR